MRKFVLLSAAAATVAAFTPVIAAERECVSGIYPHLAMFNEEGECGTGAVVPWAGDLWVITYGPHCPVGSTDKLYRIKPDLTRETFPGSVGGTPANRIIHRETNQLLIGPYVIDAKGKVRVVPPAKMPGRLTANARHLTDPARKAYYATMEEALFEVDLETLEVNTLIQDDGINKRYFDRAFNAGNAPAGWYTAPVPKLPGYHGKGMMNGFGKLFYANNGEHSSKAETNPFIPAGALGWWDKPGDDWHLVRRCQFTEVTSPDGIYGNEHPETNPVWTLGWDAKSVILGVTTNGAEWAYYRLPKASHAYDGAYGWNTEWPRIRDVGFGDGTFLATMHGTFWKFPKGFSPANPNGIRPISTYLKVIGDFCRWGDRIVFGCDDQAKSEFLGKRGLKKDAPRCERSQSNLWFVKPEELKSFGSPSGEGYVWLNEDVKAGDVSDPYLHAGYESMRFSFTRADGTSVNHELVQEGDWVRVRCLEDAKGATARFRYGPAPCKTPPLDKAKPFIEVTDDNGKVWRFPNVNGDTNVVCREIATERDLLYVGGVWYEVPAENAGGFSALRPIALADEPVRTLEGRLGLMYMNGKAMTIDDLWKNGTAPAAYWLWERFGEGGSPTINRNMEMTRREFLKESLSALGFLALPGGWLFASPPGWKPKGKPNLVFGVISDTHLRTAVKGNRHGAHWPDKYFEAALRYFKEQEVDAVVHCGDMAHRGQTREMEFHAEAWKRVFGGVENGPVKLFVTGNRDVDGSGYGGFVKKRYPDPAERAKYVLATDMAANWGASLQDIAEGLKTLPGESRAPVFYIQHRRPLAASRKMLLSLRNVLAFFGHNHWSASNWNVISLYKGNLPVVQVPSCEPRGCAALADCKEIAQMKPIKTERTGKGRQGYVVRVYDDMLVIARREFGAGGSLGADWEMPLGKMPHRLHIRLARRARTGLRDGRRTASRDGTLPVRPFPRGRHGGRVAFRDYRIV